MSEEEREYGEGARLRAELRTLKEIMLRHSGLTFAPGMEPKLDMAKALEGLCTDLDNAKYFLARRNEDQQKVHDTLVDLLSESTVHADDVKLSVSPLLASYVARVAADEIRHLRLEIIRLKEKFRLSSEVPQEAVDELVEFWHESDHGKFLDDAARDFLAKWWPSRPGNPEEAL